MFAERPPVTRGIRHVALKCHDIERLERFYVGHLGYQVEWRPDPENVYLTNGHDSLALHLDVGSSASADSRLDHIGVLLTHTAEVDAWAAFFRDRGIELDTEPRTHRDGCRSFYLKDPEGNRIQFLWHPNLSLKG